TCDFLCFLMLLNNLFFRFKYQANDSVKRPGRRIGASRVIPSNVPVAAVAGTGVVVVVVVG
ncbi:TPA: hypothetical protein ACWW19_005598, partial [Klebsiella quasipneumoniae subsp. similipneumoniae]